MNKVTKIVNIKQKICQEKLGKKLSEEHKRKISESLSGRGKMSCKKCGNCNKEFCTPLHWKRKFCSKNCANKANAKKNSESKKGNKNPMYGKKAWNTGLRYESPKTKGVNHFNWGNVFSRRTGISIGFQNQ